MVGIKEFIADTEAAITVDWIVLTAAIVGIMFASLTLFLSGTTDHADLMAAELSAKEIGGGY